MKIIFPDYAMRCLNTIESNGYEAWFVGGCVRDSIIGREFFDIDITTNAHPDDIERIFEKTVPTGKKHGTITVIIDKNPIEVTTYRSEFGYDDKRHPNSIRFETDISADLSRRDFTINALAFNPKRELLDLFDGIKDLENKIIRTVGNPEERFSEDALRILRAFRFESQLGFSIDPDTEKAALKLSGSLTELSGERVLSELKKLFCGNKPYIIEKLLENRSLASFGIGKLKSISSFIHSLNDENKTAALIYQCEHDIKLVKNSLKADNALIKSLELMSNFEELSLPENKTELKLIFNRYPDGIELYLDFIRLTMGENIFSKISGFYKEIIENNEPYLIRHLCIGGYELQKLGIKDLEIGNTLNRLINEVIKNPVLNEKNKLINIVNK